MKRTSKRERNRVQSTPSKLLQQYCIANKQQNIKYKGITVIQSSLNRTKGTADSFCMTCKLSLGKGPTEIPVNQNQAHQTISALRLQAWASIRTVMLFTSYHEARLQDGGQLSYQYGSTVTCKQVLGTRYFPGAFLPFFPDGGVLLAFHCSTSASRSPTVTKLLAKSEWFNRKECLWSMVLSSKYSMRPPVLDPEFLLLPSCKLVGCIKI